MRTGTVGIIQPNDGSHLTARKVGSIERETIPILGRACCAADGWKHFDSKSNLQSAGDGA